MDLSRNLKWFVFNAGAILALSFPPVDAATLRVRFYPENSENTVGQGPSRIEVRVVGDQGIETIQTIATIPGVAEFQHQPNGPLLVSIHSDQWWGQPVSVTSFKEGEIIEASMRVMEASAVQGVSKQPKEDSSPESIVAGFFLEDPETVSNPQLVREVCTVDTESGEFRCVIPSRVSDFRLNAPSFSSRFFWNQSLKPGEVEKLGYVTFQPGGSLVGRITTWDGADLPQDCSISVLPTGLDQRPGRAGRKHMVSQASMMPHGFFQFGSLASGNYTLLAAAGQYAPIELSGIVVLEGRESNLMEPLVLKPTANLDVVVDPPVDSEDRPWLISVGSSKDHRDFPVVQADPSGLATIPGLYYGKYLIQVKSQDDDGFWAGSVSVEAPNEFFPISLDADLVEGKVLLGGDPLKATLVFGGKFGAISAKLKSDAKGEFSGILPHLGRWEVDILAQEEQFEKTVVVDVPPPKNGVSEVEITLPNTDLRGRVVTEWGAPPASDTEVSVLSLGPGKVPSSVEVNEDGEFLFRGLAEGPARIWAEAWAEEVGSSDEFETMLNDGDQLEKNLTLHPKRTIRGVITAQGRPLPGARVRVKDAGDLLVLGKSVTSDATGNWEVDVPKNARTLNVRVYPPGWGVLGKLHQIETGETEDFIILDVGNSAGRLVVHFPPDPFDGPTRHDVFLRYRNATIFSGNLKRWARAHDSSLPFPAEPGLLITGPVHPGRYDVCFLELGSADWIRFLLDQYWLPPGCKSIEVSSFGESEVRFEQD